MEHTETAHVEAAVQLMSESTLVGRRVRKAREDARLTLARLDHVCGFPRGTVRDIESGKNMNPSLERLELIAFHTGCDLSWLRGGSFRDDGSSQPHLLEDRAPHVGRLVEEGAFRFMLHSIPWRGPIDEDRKVFIKKDPRYPQARHFAFEIMEDLLLPSGVTIPTGVDLYCIDIADANLDISDGKLYLIRRRKVDDEGASYEWTIRVGRVYRDRYEFVPVSTKPGLRAFIIPRNQRFDDPEAEISVLGQVYQAAINL